MSVTLTTTSRNYLSVDELEVLANITVTNNTEALRQIARAEQAIDDYVGFQQKHIANKLRIQPSSVSSDGKTIYDTSGNTQIWQRDGYFKGCLVEIIGGTGAGQVRLIDSSDYDDKSITVTDAWDTKPDTTSFIELYQLAKFPRFQDVQQNAAGTAYYKSIPSAIKQAVAAQIEFMIAQGDSFFTGDDSSKESESIGDYSYSRGGAGAGGQSAAVRMLGPRARTLLRGYKNSTGRLIAENPTNL